MTEMERQIIGIISSSGQSKSMAFEALKKVKTGEYDEAIRLIDEARKIDIESNSIQTKLIQAQMTET